MNDLEIQNEQRALIEMYQAGYRDAFVLTHKMKNKNDWKLLSLTCIQAFEHRFNQQVKAGTKIQKEASKPKQPKALKLK